MYQTSAAFGNLIQQDSRTFQARITLGEKTVTEGIKSMKLNGGSNSEDDFSIGSVVSQYVEITIAASDVLFEGHEFLLELGVVVNDSVEEYVPMGYFTAEKPKGDEELVTFAAYDRMIKTERPCSLSLPGQTNTIDVLKAVGNLTGVPVVTEGLAPIPMQRPDGYTCREVLSYAAQMYGGFAVCNRQGRIEIKTYEDHDYTVGTGRYWDTFTHNDLSYSLEKITCYTGKDEAGEDISITVGEGMRGISISNPFMTQAVLNDVWAGLGNYTYMPGSFRFLGDPRIDPWDILTVEDRNGRSYKVPAMKLAQDFDGGLSTEVEAVGKTEAEQESGFRGPMAQQMERYYAQLVLIDHAMVNKLDAETARITYATVENLKAVEASIQDLGVASLTARVAIIEEAYIGRAEVDNLLSDYATITNLNAANANITSLTSRFASFEQATAQELVAAKGWMLEGSIGDAQISNVAANKLSSGTVDTSLVTVAGSDGRLRIIDNTIQISDADRVRVQIGKDGSGDYTLAVWDSSGNLIWDALGATENTIQRKIIRDKMVADDAAIQALKLDLQSFNTALTDQGVSISGTVVQVGNKTLNVALTEQTQLLTDHGETLTDHAARITANENAISLKVSTREYESYQSTVNNEIATAKSRLSTAESSITAMQGQIALKVSQTDIDEAVNNLQVGGRNLIVGSSTALVPSKWVGSGWGGLFAAHSKAERIYRLEAFNGWNAYRYILDKSYAGKQVTLSFKAKNVSAGTTATADYRLFCTNEAGTNPYITLFLTSKETAQDVWVDISVTVTLNEDAQIGIGTQCAPEGNNLNAVWLIKDVKLEVGNKATDWSPAPEDIDSSINAVDAKFADYSTTAQMQSEINLAKDSITQSVSATYATKASVDTVSGKVTNLTSRVQTAESKLTKDGLTTIVGDYYTTAAYVGSAIDGIEIGGRNLLRRTKDFFLDTARSQGWWNSGTWTFSTDNEGFVIASKSQTGKTTNNIPSLYGPKFSVRKGDKLVFSCWFMVDNVDIWDGSRSPYIFEVYDSAGTRVQYADVTITAPYTNKPTVESGKWVYFYSVHTVIAESAATASMRVSLFRNGSIHVKKCKVEYGTKTTDWSPAPEDIDSSIASVQTIATQAADKFNWLVKSGTSATDFTLTDRTATLVANAINLKGLVTFSGLDSTAQGKINTAQTTASNAATSAAAAQSTANTA